MPPGPELDALVARFMGYKVEKLSKWPEYWPSAPRDMLVRVVWAVPDSEGDGSSVEGKHGEGEGEWRPWRIPKYSSDIAEAWKAFIRVCEIYQYADVGLRQVGLFHDQMGANEIVHGVDAAHAIALAAAGLLDGSLVKMKRKWKPFSSMIERSALLGQRVEHVLMEYEGPALMSVVDGRGRLLAVASDDGRGDRIRYVQARVTDEEWSAFLSGTISALDVFQKDTLQVIDRTCDGAVLQGWEVPAANLNAKADLPEPDAKLPHDIGERVREEGAR